MKSKSRIVSVLAGLLIFTLMPLNGASAEQTRTVTGGSLYALQCFGNHSVEFGVVAAETGEFTAIGGITPASFLSSNTCIKMLTYDSSANTGFGYFASLDYSTFHPTTRIHSLNFATGVISSGIDVSYPLAGSVNNVFGFAVDPTSHKYYLLYKSYVDDTYEFGRGIRIAEVDPTTGSLTNDQVVADNDGDLEKGAAPRFVTSGFSYNSLNSKFYITTGNSAGDNQNNGLYHLYSYDPATTAFSDVDTQTSIETVDPTTGITPHSFFTMAFDSSGIMWGIATTSNKLVTQSATINSWTVPGDLKLSNAAVITGGNFALAFAPPLPQPPVFSLSATSESGVPGTAISSYAINSTGGGIASYSISPAIENGLSFSTVTGLISGSPSVAAPAVTYTITATNATGSASATYSLTVNAGTVASAPTEAQVKAAAAVAAAKREAEVKTARADISSKLASAQALTADAFAKAEIAGVTADNFADVQVEILALPAESRTDITQVLKIARKYEVVGKIASEQLTNLPINIFVEVGLIPADSKNKTSLIAAVKRAAATDRNSFAEIQMIIAAETAKITTRKDRLAAILNKVR